MHSVRMYIPLNSFQDNHGPGTWMFLHFPQMLFLRLPRSAKQNESAILPNIAPATKMPASSELSSQPPARYAGKQRSRAAAESQQVMWQAASRY